MADLFDSSPDAVPDSAPRPLADRLRPARLEEVIGQEQVLGPEAPLGVMLKSGALSSLVFWGPPGVGKTTIARLLADVTDLHFVQISAIFTGVQELRKVFEAAKHRRANGQGTLLFVDEIHRFNKAQQDGFLPHMEDGTILLVGATTENPSFELNAALLSRAQVLVLTRLDILDDFETVKVCVAYEVNGERIDRFPANTSLLAKCQPVYEELPGWDEPTASATSLSQLASTGRFMISSRDSLSAARMARTAAPPYRWCSCRWRKPPIRIAVEKATKRTR